MNCVRCDTPSSSLATIRPVCDADPILAVDWLETSWLTGDRNGLPHRRVVEWFVKTVRAER